jgi:ABC-type phosphate transport system substrate-binding protein
MSTRAPLRTRRLLGSAVLATVVLASLTGLFGTTPARSATRTFTVTPATDLGNQVVQATWTGFDPTSADGFTDSVTIVQCRANPTSLKDCYTVAPFPDSAGGNSVQTAQTGPDGTGTAFFEVRPTAQLPALGCSQSHPCSLVAFENDGRPVAPGTLPLTSVSAGLTFAKSADDCPPVQSFDVRLEGEESGLPAVERWAADLCGGNDATVVDYTTTSSNQGRADFLDGSMDVGVTSLPASAAEKKSAPKRTFAYAPLDVNAVVIGYNIVDPVTHQRITDLTLSPRLFARLVTDSDLLDFFTDPEFMRLNPNHHWPELGVAAPLVRADINADTTIATRWIARDSRAMAFVDGNDPEGQHVTNAFRGYHYPVGRFANEGGDTGFVPLLGEQGVLTHAFYAAKASDGFVTPPDQQGFMTVVDRPGAERFDLPMARLVNASGNAVAPDDAALVAAEDQMVPDANGFRSANVGATGTAYPLTKIDYAMVPLQPSKATTTAHLRAFLEHVAGSGQDDLPIGYVALPPPLRDQTTAVARKVGTSTPTPSSTTTTPATTTTTTPPGGSGDGSSPADGGSGPYAASAALVAGGSSAAGGATGTGPTVVSKRHTSPIAAWFPDGVYGSSAVRMVLPLLLLLGIVAGAVACSPEARRRIARVRRRPSTPSTGA